MRVDRRWKDEVQRLRRTWDIIWNPKTNRYQVIDRLSEHLGNKDGYRIIYVVEEQDHSFRPLDWRTINHLRRMLYETRLTDWKKAAQEDVDREEKAVRELHDEGMERLADAI